MPLDKGKTQERADGWYWVRFEGATKRDWSVAWWDKRGKEWIVGKGIHEVSVLVEEIGPRIPSPDEPTAVAPPTRPAGLEIDALLELCAKATPGPWTTHKMEGHTAVAANTLIALVFSTAFKDLENERVNAHLISAARTALPLALQHILALEAQIAGLRADKSLDTDRLEWLADEVTELWFGGRKFDVGSDADVLRAEIDNAARKHLSQLKTKLEAIDAAKGGTTE